MSGCGATVRQVSGRETFSDDVAYAARCDVWKPAGLQSCLKKLVCRHAGGPDIQQRLGFVDESKARLKLRCVEFFFFHA